MLPKKNFDDLIFFSFPHFGMNLIQCEYGDNNDDRAPKKTSHNFYLLIKCSL